MESEENKRTFTRVGTEVRAEISDASGVTFSGQLQDVSMNGVFIGGVDRVALGASCHVTLWLDGGAGAIPIRACGKVSRVTSAGVAIEFEDVDADGLQHLRNLVLYNAQSTEPVEEEIVGSLGIKRARG